MSNCVTRLNVTRLLRWPIRPARRNRSLYLARRASGPGDKPSSSGKAPKRKLIISKRQELLPRFKSDFQHWIFFFWFCFWNFVQTGIGCNLVAHRSIKLTTGFIVLWCDHVIIFYLWLELARGNKNRMTVKIQSFKSIDSKCLIMI